MGQQRNLSIGADFLGYRIEGPIGQGGMGVVYLAYDLRLKRRVALKLMTPELAQDERFRERFARESELVMSLEHPNVVPIHDAGEADGQLYIAMRHVEGTDLKALLRKEGALGTERSLTIVRQVAAALDAAHASGLVHRDVKPSNVLVDARGHVYLADFGLTRQVADRGVESGGTHSLGTPAYLAPEQIEGGAVDGRADVYSLGCLLFECLTGEAPFLRDTRLAVIWAHLEEEPPRASERAPGVPDAIDAVIRTAMAKDAARRYSTCAELVSAAEALGLRGGRGFRRPAALVFAGAVVSTVLALVAVGFSRGGDEAAASSLAAVRANTLVRLDPATNVVEGVIRVGANPVAAAVGGGRVWVLSEASVSEIDPASNEPAYSTAITSTPTLTESHLGPVLAADANGAWMIGFDFDKVRYRLTKILPRGRGERDVPLDVTPIAVQLGERALWVLATSAEAFVVLRLDPTTGAVTGRTSLPVSAGADGLGVGAGAVWVTASSSAELFRIDARTVRVTGKRDLGGFSSLPVVGYGAVWVCVANPGSTMLRIDPRTMRDTIARYTIPADGGRFAPGYGSMWRHDVPTGAVMRFDPRDGDLAATIRVTPAAPQPSGGGLVPTSIAVGADAVWVPIARE